MKVCIFLILIIAVGCTQDNALTEIGSVKKDKNETSELNTKCKLFSDFDLFKLKGVKEVNDKKNYPLIFINYDENGRISSLHDSLGQSLKTASLVFNYSSNRKTAKLKGSGPTKQEELGEYVNYIFQDSIVIVLYSYETHIIKTNKDALYLYKVCLLRNNLTEDVYYFEPNELIIKDELDFKFSYLTTYDRKDSKSYVVDKNKLTVTTKSTLETENKVSCYNCEIPFSLYWWLFYESLMYQETNCK